MLRLICKCDFGELGISPKSSPAPASLSVVPLSACSLWSKAARPQSIVLLSVVGHVLLGVNGGEERDSCNLLRDWGRNR